MIVLAFLALYVLEGIFTTVRANCDLKNHAHDLRDLLHAVHAVEVRNSLFYFIEKLQTLIKAPHSAHDSQA